MHRLRWDSETGMARTVYLEKTLSKRQVFAYFRNKHGFRKLLRRHSTKSGTCNVGYGTGALH